MSGLIIKLYYWSQCLFGLGLTICPKNQIMILGTELVMQMSMGRMTTLGVFLQQLELHIKRQKEKCSEILYRVNTKKLFHRQLAATNVFKQESGTIWLVFWRSCFLLLWVTIKGVSQTIYFHLLVKGKYCDHRCCIFFSKDH